MATGARAAFAGLTFDRLGLEAVLDWLAARSAEDRLAYLVTPNVDHAVRLHDKSGWAELASAYRDADLCLCDSRVLALLARLRGVSLPVVPGSDLTERFLRHRVPDGRSVLLIGGAPGAGEALSRLLPGRPVFQHVPPMGLLANPEAMRACVAAAIERRADYVLLAVGSPQQELIAHALAAHPDARGTALCIGASVDFLTGQARRAPRWMRALALEWLHRLLSDPARLWKRYLVDGPRILRIALLR